MMDPSLVASPSLIREWRRRRMQPQQFLSPNARTLLPTASPPRVRLPSGPGLHYGRSRRLRSFVYGRRLMSLATDDGGNSRIRRCSSAPSTLRNKRTPPLATIPEEPIGNVNAGQIPSSSESPTSIYSPPHAASVDYVLEQHRRHLAHRSAHPVAGPSSLPDETQEDQYEYS